MKVDFDSDIIGEVAAPGRQKRPLVVAANQCPLPQDLERHFGVMVLSSTYKPNIYLHPFGTYVGNSLNRQPRAAQPRRGLLLEKTKPLMRRTGGCGVGGRDDPSLNAYPNVDIGEQYDVYDARNSLHLSASLHISALDAIST